MSEDKTYFTINLPQWCRPLLDELAAQSRRSRPNVITTLLEQAIRQPSLVGIPSIPAAAQRDDHAEDAA